MLTAKTVIPNKFWILESKEGIRKGTIRSGNSSVSVLVDNVETVYENLDKACWDLAIDMDTPKVEEPATNQCDSVLDYPVKCAAFNPIWDLKRKIPVFTKTEKSKTLHAAGYYIIQFDTGWTQSFCPKVSTLDSNNFKGPFKDKLEMRERLRKENGNDNLD